MPALQFRKSIRAYEGIRYTTSLMAEVVRKLLRWIYATQIVVWNLIAKKSTYNYLVVERIPVREPFSVGLGCALVLRNVDSVITIWIRFSKLSIAIVCS